MIFLKDVPFTTLNSLPATGNLTMSCQLGSKGFLML